ncbi:hypothetical protein RFI_25185 [Reticulomyxa filosa]|uniref:RING-type domain-containing protein n=1 Tax=Reticulomyxa filosa TaxID=46433 RepID=X6MDU7_RETFI|nr:hypothetical protein RFI_25185 [Reticulomyxa filosa]|eukprot:ETO12193.1 hypothetical protein RFI_25185 [Reticulomyxa filosa]
MVKPQQNGNRSGLMQCVNSNCKADLCSNCNVPWHTDLTCEEFQKQQRNRTQQEDAAFHSLMKKEKWRACPRCGVVVERSEGCYHMTHVGCEKGDDHRTDFCYFCGEELTKKDGEGWRYSKATNEKHFPDGVYAKCVKASQSEDITPLETIFYFDKITYFVPSYLRNLFFWLCLALPYFNVFLTIVIFGKVEMIAFFSSASEIVHFDLVFLFLSSLIIFKSKFDNFLFVSFDLTFLPLLNS